MIARALFAFWPGNSRTFDYPGEWQARTATWQWARSKVAPSSLLKLSLLRSAAPLWCSVSVDAAASFLCLITLFEPFFETKEVTEEAATVSLGFWFDPKKAMQQQMVFAKSHCSSCHHISTRVYHVIIFNYRKVFHRENFFWALKLHASKLSSQCTEVFYVKRRASRSWTTTSNPLSRHHESVRITET